MTYCTDKSLSDADQYVNTREAATIVGCSINAMHYYLRAGKFPEAIKLVNKAGYKIPRSALFPQAIKIAEIKEQKQDEVLTNFLLTDIITDKQRDYINSIPPKPKIKKDDIYDES